MYIAMCVLPSSWDVCCCEAHCAHQESCLGVTCDTGGMLCVDVHICQVQAS